MNPPKPAKVNERGRRIGEDHPRAVLTDHEVTLLQELLDRRTELVELLEGVNASWTVIRVLLASEGLSYRALAEKFDISKTHVADIDRGRRRCQTAV